MSRAAKRALVWGLAVAALLRFGLEPLGWMFYELSHLTGIDALYYGYSAFRGAGYAFGLWDWQGMACALAGLAVAAWVYYRNHRKELA